MTGLVWARSLAGALACLFLASGLAAAQPPAEPRAGVAPIVPAARSVRAAPGAFRLGEDSLVQFDASDADAKGAADYFVGLIRQTCGLALKAAPAASAGPVQAIRFSRTRTGGDDDEAYTIDVRDGRIDVRGGRAGLFYGGVSLWQLASPAGACPPDGRIAGVHIEDGPRFRWRGLMLDSARHFQSIETVRRLIDWMAINKLNTLHWHLTDNQGWRLEIKRYPRLTEVGAWRIPPAIPPRTDIDPATGKPTPYGGFYTQDQVRALVRYAADRHVTIVPEIDIPGHSLAALAAYPKLSVSGAPATVAADWGLHLDSYNLDKATFTFLDGVLDEVMALFPSKFIHIGGDEVVPLQWLVSDRAQAQIHALGLKGADDVQGYINAHLEQDLAAHGRRMMGWDEIGKSDRLDKTVAIMSWRGVDGAVAAARAGRDTVLSPYPTWYLDSRQGDFVPEAPTWLRISTLKDVYDFDPQLPQLTEDERRHVLGVQANAWTELTDSEPRLTEKMFPRAIALAETAWSPPAAHDWTGFLERLAPAMRRDESLGLQASRMVFRPRLTDQIGPDRAAATVAIDSQSSIGELHYTLDESTPTAGSPRYGAPLQLKFPATLKVALFKDGAALSEVVSQTYDAHAADHYAAADLTLCKSGLMMATEDDGPVNGPRAILPIDPANACWVLPNADLSDVTALAMQIGEVPGVMPATNFGYAQNPDLVPIRPPRTPNGELEVRADGCTGPLILSLPLDKPRGGRGLQRLSGAITARQGRHDLCFSFTGSSDAVWWALAAVQLERAAHK